MTDEALSHALSTIRAAAEAEGHDSGMVDDLDELIELALRHAARDATGGDEIRDAAGTLWAWAAEARGQARRRRP